MNRKKLGFGLMRLPLLDPADTAKIDCKTLCEMVDKYMSAGFNYFDTAYPYHNNGNSELAFCECVAKRYPRDSYTITDKLTPFFVNRREDLEGYFSGQLERCGVDYLDYYLLHAVDREILEKAERIGAFEFMKKKKEEGKIRHIGFSFHDSAQVLNEILTNHPEMEYVQLQINYADWENFEVQSRACYETAVRHKKNILVMEPVKGGLLANIPREAELLFKEAEPEMSVASWAVRFASSLDNVVMVLSGMSNIEQVEDNLSYMRDFKPLTDEEKQLVMNVADIIKSKESIACTGCRYCVDDCPQKIGIPDYFRLMNEISKFGEGQIESAKQHYAYCTGSAGMGKASSCIKCGRCEKHCPQHLSIRKYLEDTVKVFEA